MLEHREYMYVINRVLLLFLLLLIPFVGRAQEQGDLVRALINAGFENVSRVTTENEEIITFENGARRVNSDGVSDAISIIQLYPEQVGKIRKVIVLSNNVPQISLTTKQDAEASGVQWKTDYKLGDAWRKIRSEKRKNSSLGKIDIVLYPQFAFRNQKYHKVYDVLLNIAPALEISPLRGMKLTGQLIIPLINQYGPAYGDVRPGFITIQQNVRVENCFIEATVGCFNKNRWGADLYLFRPFTKEGWLNRFALEGRVGLTGSSYFYDWNWHYGTAKLITWNFGGRYYNAQYNVECNLKVEKFLAGDVGVRADMTRHFRRASVGFYIMKNNKGNIDGGFHFAVALPPLKQKRGKYIRVRPANYFDLEYQAAGLFYNGHSYKTRPGQNRAEYNFNPIYIKSSLVNNQ